MYVLYDDTRSFIHEMNDDRIMSRTCLRQRSVIITDKFDTVVTKEIISIIRE